MSFADNLSASDGVKATVAPRSGKHVTYVVTEAGKEAEGLNKLPRQSQLVWQGILAVCEKTDSWEFTLEDANVLCRYMYDNDLLNTKQEPNEIFSFYRSLDATKRGGRGYLSRGWLSVKA